MAIIMKEIGVQASLQDSANPQDLGKLPNPELEFPQIFYRRHTVLWGLSAVLLLAYTVLSQPIDPDTTKGGILASVLVLMFCCAVHLPDSGLMSRPHPVFWRLLQGAALCYLAFLVFLAFQSLQDARNVFKWFDENLGKPLPERHYATECDIYTPNHPESSFYNIKSCVFDVFMICHLLGWWFKMIIVRDVKLCWFLSIFFEFLEITLRHQLPNFYECWWDHVILDILIANGGGIYLGYLTCSFCEMKQYHWGMGKDTRQANGRFSALSRSATQLTPFSWKVYKWDVFSSSKNFISTLWYVVFVNLVDLSNFYLKFILWVPASHWTLFIRVNFWACLAVVSTGEYYDFIRSDFKGKLGTFCWLSHFILAIEWLITLKFANGMFVQEMPMWIQVTWSGILVAVLTEAIYLFYKDQVKTRN